MAKSKDIPTLYHVTMTPRFFDHLYYNKSHNRNIARRVLFNAIIGQTRKKTSCHYIFSCYFYEHQHSFYVYKKICVAVEL